MGTFVVGAAVLGLVILAAYKVYKGGGRCESCGCGCQGCSKRAGPGNMK